MPTKNTKNTKGIVLTMNDGLAIGVDLGATKIAAVLATRSGEVLAARQTATLVASGSDVVFDRIAGEIRALVEAAPGRVLGVGIGSPGLIDGVNGVVKTAVNMAPGGGWKNVPLGPEVSRRCGLPVVVENDACAAAVGEGYFGSAAGSKDYVLLTVGSGLGSGVIAGGRLVTGAYSVGTDLGHYSLDPDHGLKCLCGKVGCAETLCSGPGLVNAAKLWMAEHGKTWAGEMNPAAIVAGAAKGDEAALGAIEIMARAMGHIAAVAGSVIDPDVIVIGGGLGVAAFALMKSAVEREYRRRAPLCQVVPAFRASTLASSALGSASLVYSRLATKS